MIQDIGENRFSNVFAAKSPSSGSKLMVFDQGGILLKNTTPIEFPRFFDLQRHCEKECRPLPALIYLFSIGEDDYFLCDPDESSRRTWEQEGVSCVRMFETRSLCPRESVFAAATAWHLYCWYCDNRFCGRCASSLIHDKKQRMMRCPSCGNQVFPKIAPAVIVGVVNGDQILMTKYAGREYKKYALIAGFTEIGETAEQTVEREVFEETGIKVKNIRYYKSQPWGFDANLLLGYFCEAAKPLEIHMDAEELSAAEWVDYDKIPDDDGGLSLTAEMMTVFREYKKREERQNDKK